MQVVGIGTIVDDDAAPDIMIDDASTVEGDPLVFDVTLSNPSSQPIVLDLSSVDVTATSTSDYSGVFEYSIDGGATWIPATSGTQVTVPALATAIQVRTATTEDTTLESTETMTLAIAGVVSGTAGNTSDTATGTIIDDDAALVSIVANDPVAGEPSDNAQFTVSMTNPTASPTVIAYSVSGSATSGVDYTALSGTITLPPGATSGLIDLTVLDDAIIEGLEDVTITLTSITSGDPQVTIDAANDEATATITDDDEATWQLTGVTTVNEGAVAIYNVGLVGELQSGEAVSVDLSVNDNTTLATDYASFNSAVSAAVAAYTGPGSLSLVGTTLTFTSDGAGAMAQLPIQLLATNDIIVEGPEDYDVSISGAASTTGAAINIDVANNTVNTTIEDTIDAVGTSNDTASWSISGPTTADEAATAQYTVSLDAALGANETATVDISLTDIDTNSSDYASFLAAVAAAAAVNPDVVFNAATGTLTYTAPSDGATMTDLVINLGITDDTIIEGPEDFQINLTSPGSSSGAVIAIDPLASSVTTTINDTQGIAGLPDGPAEWSIIGPTSADEGTTAQYTVALSGQFGAGEVVIVDLGLTDIDTNSSDYASILAAITAAAAMNADVTFNAATGTLTYTALSDGASMTDLVIDLDITDDTIIEGPEDYSLTLNNATTATGANVSIDAAADEVTTTINDTQGLGGVADGPAEWSITGTTSADEGTTAQYIVALSGQFGAGEVVTVDLGLTDIDTNGSDYASIVAAITAAAAANPDVTFNPATGTLTYTAPSDGASMTDLVIDLGITDDVIIEGPEDFSLALSNATTSTGANVAIDSAAIDVTTTINDTQGIGGAPDGSAEWSITGAITVDEGATAQYEIELSGAFGAGEVATIDVSLTELTTNATDHATLVAGLTVAAAANPDVTFNVATGTFTYIAPSDGAAMTPLIVNVAITDDTFIEGSEQYNIALSNPGSTSGASILVSSTQGDVTTTINDTQGVGNDADGPAEWSITGPAAIDEGATAQYTVALSGLFGEGEIVTVDLGLTDIDTNSTDYASIVAAISAGAAANPDVTFNAATGTLVYTSPNDGASMSDLVIALGIVDDPIIEGPEDFSLALTNATTSTGANVAIDLAAFDVTTTINDTQGSGGATDGPAVWSITGPTSVDEGATAQYTVALSGQFGAGEVVTVDLGLTDIDTNSSDYASIVAAISAATAANPDVTFNVATGTLTYIAPNDGASMADLVIDLGIIDDVLLEGPEDYSLALTNATTSTGAAVGIDGVANNVTTTIDDTQGPGGAGEGPATWSITGTSEIGEGNSAVYTVALSGQFQAGEVVTIQLGLSDNSTNGADYGSLSTEIAAAVAGNPDLVFDTVTGTLTYTAPSDGASMSSLIFALPITDDTIVESPEDYDIVLSNSTSPTGVANVIDPGAASVNTIINGDPFVNDDVQHTTVGTPVSGNVLANDTDPDGDPLVVTTTPVVPPENGTLVLASNGSYTYTPNPGFRGVDSFDYEVCDDFGNCEIATVTIMMVDLSTSKSQVSVVPNGDNFDVEFTLTVENTGSTRMDNLSLFDDLATQFGPAFASIGSVALDASGVVGGVAPSLNAAWTANTALDILDPAVTNEFLLPGDFFSITFVVTIDPDAAGTATAISNQATVAGEDITTIPNAPLATSDDSDSGSDPSSTNPGAPGDTGGEDDATPLFIPDVRVVKQQVGTPIELPDRSWNVDFELFVENTSTTELTGVSLLDDSISQLGSVWQGSSNLSIDGSGVSLGGVAPGLNTGWLSDPSQDILDGTGVLQPGESFGVTFTLNLDPDNTPSGLAQPITNQATATGIANSGSGPVVVEDVSDSGADANTTNSGAPGDTGGSNDPTPIEISEIGAAKRIVSSVPIVTSPGHVALTYEIRVRNLATNDLTNLTIQDNLVANLGPAFQGLVSPPTLLSSTASINPTFNSTFDGASSIELLDGASGLLRPGEEFVVQYSLDVQVDLVTTNSINQVLAGADDGGAGVTDLSDSGSDPAGSNPNTTGDTGGEDDPTLPPAIGIAKDHGTPIEVGENFLVPIDLVVRNLGVTNLSNLAIVEDLMSSFGPAFVSVSTPVVDASGVVGGTGPSVNGSWAGNTSNNLLDGSGTLTPNDEFTISFDVTIDPDATGTSQYLFNQAIVTANDPTNPGLQVVDTSDSGRDPTSSNLGEPGDTGLTDDPTPLEITDIGLAKTLELRGQTGASFIVTIALFVENTGTVDLTNLSLIDDVSAEFAPHTVVVVAAPRFVTSNATIDPNFNAGFVGDSSQDIFDLSSGLLAPGESFVVELDVQINPNFAATSDGGLQLANQATAGGEGVGSNGVILSAVSDASDSGTNPNSNNGDGGFSDATQISIGVFAFDSFNNFSQPFGRHATRTPFFRPNPILDSTYTGISAPGTTLSFNVYDNAGRETASRTVVADAAGNWLVSLSTVQDNGYQPNQQFNTFALQNSSHRLGSRAFVGSTLGHRLYHESVSLQQTQRVEVRQTPALHNIRVDSGNFRWTGQVHFQSALRPTSYFVDRTTVDRVFAESPSASLRALHMLNSNPLQLGLDANELASPVRSFSW